jgi:DNA-binding NarL/FixJ family response regulator
MPRIPEPVYVAVVNDYPVVTAGVAALLRPLRHRVRVEEFPASLPPRGRVDVILFDPFGHPDPELRLKEILEQTRAKVLVFGWTRDQGQIEAVLQIGAAGYLSKTVEAEEIVEAVEAVHAGQTLATPTSGSEAMIAWPGEAQGLTPRESEIVSFIVAGLSNKETAEACYLSINSVKTYIRTAYRKMGVQTRAKAVVWGIQHGFQIVDRPLARVED